VRQVAAYWVIWLATCENTLLALPPIGRMVPITITKITASITAYSAMSYKGGKQDNGDGAISNYFQGETQAERESRPRGPWVALRIPWRKVFLSFPKHCPVISKTLS